MNINLTKFDNDRMVTKNMKVIKPLIDDERLTLLCCDSMYGSSVMDGKLKIMKLE